MKILIAGLGLMGGAYAYRLRNKGHIIYGYDINKESLLYAKEEGFIDFIASDELTELKECNLLIIALYPKLIVPFINKYKDLFTENLYITDLASVKANFLLDAQKLAKPARYISHHPMAGREKSGVKYAKECNFDSANFLITTTDANNQEDVEFIKKIGLELGFSNIVCTDYLNQDKMISYTSALTHAIAVSLVNSTNNSEIKNFIGDSYRDLTRIASINEILWTELFFENKENLLNYIKIFEGQLDRIKEALNNNDIENLKQIFISSTKLRNEMNK